MISWEPHNLFSDYFDELNVPNSHLQNDFSFLWTMTQQFVSFIYLYSSSNWNSLLRPIFRYSPNEWRRFVIFFSSIQMMIAFIQSNHWSIRRMLLMIKQQQPLNSEIYTQSSLFFLLPLFVSSSIICVIQVMAERMTMEVSWFFCH